MRGFSIGMVLLFGLLAGSVRGQAPQRPDSVLLFVDDLHIAFTDTPRLRTGIQQATERLLAAGRSVGLVSDGPSAILIQPTNDRASLLEAARRISGGGLKASELANPTPAITADRARREAAAQTVVQRTITAMKPNVVLYVTGREAPPTGVWMSLVLTKPVDIDAAAVRLMALRDALVSGSGSGVVIGTTTIPR